MIPLLDPPQFWDGGYWYVTTPVTEPELGALTPGIDGEFAAWYGVGVVIVRTPDVLVLPGATDADLSFLPSKPVARLRGR